MNRAKHKLLGVLFAAVLLLAASLSAQQNKTGDIPVNGSGQPVAADTIVVNGVSEPVYHSTKGIIPPRQIYSPPPDYSNETRKRKIEGVVTLSVIVTSAGKTAQIHVLQGRGYGLDEKAVAAARKWKFKPATKDGIPVSVEIALEIAFHLYHNP